MVRVLQLATLHPQPPYHPLIILCLQPLFEVQLQHVLQSLRSKERPIFSLNSLTHTSFPFGDMRPSVPTQADVPSQKRLPYCRLYLYPCHEHHLALTPWWILPNCDLRSLESAAMQVMSR